MEESKENEAIIKTIKSKIEVLNLLLSDQTQNRKKIIKELIDSYQKVQEYAKDDTLYQKELKYFLKIDEDNTNLRYKDSNSYFQLIQQELNYKLKHSNIHLSNNTEINILSSKKIDIDIKDGEKTLFKKLKKYIGKVDIFIEYKGELDNKEFMDFEEYTMIHALVVRPIFTRDSSTIYYYGGNNYKSVINAIDNIDNFAKDTGTDFNIKSYQKRK